MAILMPDGGQSSSAVNGQNTTFIALKVLQEFPAAPDTLIESKLSDVLRDFYTNAGAWREVIGPYKLSAGRNTINLNPVDQYSQLQYVSEVWIYPSFQGGNDRQFLRPSTRKLVGTDVSPTPLWYYMPTPDIMEIYPVPTVTLGQVLYVFGMLTPLTNTARLPNMSTTHHLDALMWGTLARMYRMAKKPWTDMTLAAYYEKEYRREKLRWRDVANRQNSNGTPQWRYPSFAGRNNHGTSVWGVRG